MSATGDVTPTRTARPTAGRDALLALVSTVVFLGGCELALRLLGLPHPVADPLGVDAVDMFEASIKHSRSRDPDLMFKGIPGQTRFEDVGRSRMWKVTINRDGFRGPGIGRPPGRPLVLCAGDSVTYGYALDDEYSYPLHLQELLRHDGFPQAEVINVGSMGYSSEQGRVWLSKIVPRYKPDVVIVEYGINDDRLSNYEDADLIGGSSVVRHAQVALQRSHLYRLLRQQILQLKGRYKERRMVPAARVTTTRYRDNLKAMADGARAHGAMPIFIAPTSKYDFMRDQKHDWHAFISVYRGIMGAVAAQERIPFLDVPLLSGQMRESRHHFIDVCHPDQYGTCLIAEEVEPLVRKAIQDCRAAGGCSPSP